MNGPVPSTNQAVQRLARRLQLPETTTKAQFTFEAGSVPTLTITRLLSPQEIEQLATWYVVEGMAQVLHKEVTCGLELRRPSTEHPAPQVDTTCDPLAQQQRQDELDARYLADGRQDPAHPQHATYTGLMVAQGQEPSP